MKIGQLNLKHGLFLAPMAGFSDRAMRLVCHEMGAEASVTEMVSATAVCYGDKKTRLLSRIRVDEGPVLLQIFGKEPEVMARCAAILSDEKSLDEGCVLPVGIDINMGCPVPKIYSNREGSALMRDPELIYKIVKATSDATHLPVSVKLRAGIDPTSINAVECAQAAESAGASMICVHGRTRVQMYSGQADKDIIKNVKNSLRIPVIANGDVVSAQSAMDMLNYTGADGIAVGRGAVGNPFVFREITAALSGEVIRCATFEEKIHTAIRQLETACADKGERAAVLESRKQIAQYLRSFSGAAGIRARINTAESFHEVREVLLGALRGDC